MFFFFKQKTAYEMRISDWSSDVCSSDLGGIRRRPAVRFLVRRGIPPQSDDFLIPCHPAILGPNPITKPSRRPNGEQLGPKDAPGKIGRASGRERGCQYV